MALIAVGISALASNSAAQPMPPLPGVTIDPSTIPKYAIPLVFPPIMPHKEGEPNHYEIGVRQFQQQILPGGIWKAACLQSPNGSPSTCNHPATTVWSYGPKKDPVPSPGSRIHIAPDASSGFNYPAYTFEVIAGQRTWVRWENELVRINDATGLPYPKGNRRRTALEHLFSVDQTLHWANPAMDCAFSTTHSGSLQRTDCAGQNPRPYRGPVPIVTHVHGSHVEPASDGYPEAWWLPVARHNRYFPESYATSGTLFDDTGHVNTGDLGYADYMYFNTQPATTLWYHDHSLGITRLNVYAGPAGFWLIRGGPYDVVHVGGTTDAAQLPTPPPMRGDPVMELNTPGSSLRNQVREIPILIQDRAFKRDGSLFYPDNRAYFETLNGVRVGRNQFRGLRGYKGRPYVGRLSGRARGGGRFRFAPANRTRVKKRKSMIPPIWNVETFYDVMVVNGVAWPTLDVAPARYRFRFLNGSNTRTLNMALFYNELVPAEGGRAANCHPDEGNKELPIVQIGSDGGFLDQPVEIVTGFATALPGDTTIPGPILQPDPSQPLQALLMAPAERADVIVDFSSLADGTKVRLTNTAPDSPFGGFGDSGYEPADCAFAGQVMEFVVKNSLKLPSDDDTTSAYAMDPVSAPNHTSIDATRTVSVNEQDSDFGISFNDAPVYLPKNRRAKVGTVEDTGFYPVCAQKKCTITQPPQGAPSCTDHPDDPCPPAPAPSGFDPDHLTCSDPNHGENAYRIYQTDTKIDPATGKPERDSQGQGVCEGLPHKNMYGPMVDLLGIVDDSGPNPTGVSLRWTDDSGVSTPYPTPVPTKPGLEVKVTENPMLNDTEAWDIYNFTPDAHPIHLHLVQFNVQDRQAIPGQDPHPGIIGRVYPQEQGWKDTVIAYPGTITTVWAKFDLAGLYVWHCHILEHEDNEMMRPFYVVAP